MKAQEMLHVEWDDSTADTYYIDRDKYSKAHRVTENIVVLDTFSGAYSFDKRDGREYTTLYDGVKFIGKRIKSWKTYFTPEVSPGRESQVDKLLAVISNCYYRMATNKDREYRRIQLAMCDEALAELTRILGVIQ